MRRLRRAAVCVGIVMMFTAVSSMAALAATSSDADTAKGTMLVGRFFDFVAGT